MRRVAEWRRRLLLLLVLELMLTMPLPKRAARRNPNTDEDDVKKTDEVAAPVTVLT